MDIVWVRGLGIGGSLKIPLKLPGRCSTKIGKSVERVNHARVLSSTQVEVGPSFSRGVANRHTSSATFFVKRLDSYVHRES